MHRSKGALYVTNVQFLLSLPASKFRRKKSIITDCYDDFLTIIIDYNYQNKVFKGFIIISYFAEIFFYSNNILWVIIFVSIRKFLKERSLEHFGSSEHRVLPRNKSFIEILSYEWKDSRGR